MMIPRECRHVKAFTFDVIVNDPSQSNLPPYAVICEDCAASVFEALKAKIDEIRTRKPKPSGKSGAAVTFARMTRLIDDLSVHAVAKPNLDEPAESEDEKFGFWVGLAYGVLCSAIIYWMAWMVWRRL